MIWCSKSSLLRFFPVKIFGAKNIKQYKGEEITILNPSKVYFWLISLMCLFMNYAHTCTDIQRMFKCKIRLIHTLMKAFHIFSSFFLQCLASCPKYYLPLLWTDGPSNSNLSWPLHRRNSSSYYGKTICKFMYQHFGGRCSMNCKSQTS